MLQSTILSQRLFLEIHAQQLRERGTSSGSIFDRHRQSRLDIWCQVVPGAF